MTRRQLMLAEWLGLFACVAPMVLGVLAFTRNAVATPDPRPPAARAPFASPEGHLPDSLLHRIVAVAPFRLARHPAEASYQIGQPGVQSDAPPSTKPALVLSGIITGHHPAALLDGVPGHDGSVLLQFGDTVAGLRLRRVDAASVVITGMDTTWTLTVRQAWTQ
ncbi:MAG: hypothetical protein ACREL4_05390 [Gemmatimonadales bacterium]